MCREKLGSIPSIPRAVPSITTPSNNFPPPAFVVSQVGHEKSSNRSSSLGNFRVFRKSANASLQRWRLKFIAVPILRKEALKEVALECQDEYGYEMFHQTHVHSIPACTEARGKTNACHSHKIAHRPIHSMVLIVCSTHRKIINRYSNSTMV